MNADRLIRMAIRMLMRQGMRRLSKGQKQSSEIKQAQKNVRTVNRIRRM
ncbi:MAG: hypothetical protein AAF965_08595 [Pseudomonadota bacterium]